MTELLNSDFLEHAADLISQADALIVAAGAGSVTRNLHSATVQPGINPWECSVPSSPDVGLASGARHALAEIDGVMWAGSVRQVLSCPPSTEMLRNISILVDSPVDRLESSTNISCKI